ncbi:uncharacterized protein LOC133304504 [Gastrolobium bilobum]|uniref:uncharacterized protein LOC133304504 n=1 Tax=Gastrolobium bilobum TaxID=150636 RepID=UPI002AB2E1A6|nr:uncharacterized protein LOC133304504 [Gastrolobium bilobum]
MYIKGIEEPLITRLFATTLMGAAESWFSSLPAGSIKSFEEFGGRFLLNFATSKKQPKFEFALGKIKQQPSETLLKYFDRFKMAALQVPGLSENVHLHLVIAGLHGSSRLARSVYKNPVRTLVEFTARSKKYLELEQMEIENADPRQHHGQMEKLGNRRQSDFRGKRPEEKVSTKVKFDRYTPMNSSRSQIWREVASTEMKRVDRPRPLQNPASLDQSRYCAFHDGPGHTTDECWDLRDAIERYIREGKLRQYLIRTQGWKNNKKRRGGQLISPPREKKFRDEGRGKKPAKEEDDEFIEPEFECNVISGGFGGGGDTMNARRKYLREAFQNMNLDVEDLKPCNTALIVFNGRDTIPKGYIDLRLTLGTKEAYKSERIRFIVADFPSEYSVILGRPTIHDWDMLVSTKHQKLKMIGKQNTVITIPGDQKESRDCYFKSVRAIGSNLKTPAGVNPSNKQDNSKRAEDQSTTKEIIISLMRRLTIAHSLKGS